MSKLVKTLHSIKTFIQENGLIRENDKVLVAISAGPDSVFLAYALHKLDYSIGLVHINYQLRGETSEAEEKLVLSYAKKWDVPVFHKRMEKDQNRDAVSQSKQVIYRNFRYEFFAQVMSQYGYTKCATAHHRGDQAESILMSLTKGNHPSVIQSIPLQREQFIRPLLNLSKQEILDALKEANLDFSHDISNDSNDYLRNQFRNQVLPLLKEINPSIENQLVWKEEWYQTQLNFIHTVLERNAEQYISQKNQIKRLHFTPFIQQFGESFLSILGAWALEKWGLYGYDLWEANKLVDSQTGKFVDTAKGRISRGRNMLILEPEVIQDAPILVSDFSKPQIQMGNQTIIFSVIENEAPDFSLKNTFWLDPEKITFPITLRRWKQGDKMTPLGMKQAKKLSDIFIDQKLDPAQKRRAIIFESNGEIITLHPFRIANQVKLPSSPKKVVKIVIEG